MAVTIDFLEKYMGKSASYMLSDHPFKEWNFEKSEENELENSRIDYIFPKNGLDFVCDEHDKVRTIFLFFDEFRLFDEGLLDVFPSSTRQQLTERFGRPSKSGEGYNDPVLGEYGPWDRFSRQGCCVHIQYKLHEDLVSMVTLMRLDAVP